MSHRVYDLALRAALHHGHGLPEERYARIAARRAFVELKQSFTCACAHVAGPQRERLAHAVRQAREAVDLWRLQDEILRALPLGDARASAHGAELRRQLDSVFPALPGDSGWVPHPGAGSVEAVGDVRAAV